MSQSDPVTFSVEVVAFHGAADPVALASSLAAAFGIPSADARRLVDSAPVAVKKGADADTTREIARVLLGLGAEICIRNERTGEARIHRSSSIPPGPASLLPPRASRPAPPASSDRPPPRSRPPSSAPPPIPSDPPDTAALLARAAASSKPPALDVCAACSRRVEKGEDCPGCGWSNARGRRSCRECHRDLSAAADLWPARELPGDLTRRKLPIAAASLLALAAAAAAFHFYGPQLAGAIAAAALTAALLRVSGATALRCLPCRREVQRFQLRPTEQKEVGAARRRWLLAALLSLLVGVAFASPLFAARPDLHVDSFGIGWSASAPWSHRQLERRAVTAPSEWGPARFAVARAHNASFQVRGYYLLHTMLPDAAEPKIDDAAFVALLERAIEAAVPGAKLGATEVVEVRAGRAREGRLQGSVDGSPIGGRARASVVGRDVMVAMFVGAEGASEAAAGRAFLDSVTITSGQ